MSFLVQIRSDQIEEGAQGSLAGRSRYQEPIEGGRLNPGEMRWAWQHGARGDAIPRTTEYPAGRHVTRGMPEEDESGSTVQVGWELGEARRAQGKR